ncbi:fumarate hydratase class II [Paenibacillus sp. J31TS4]|uniref:class II fumarate hydratase n=1 Tax=Paenibacillus sp. J31TS4 TaxID=2807195 RepID=UPI001B19CFEE|nr:aspartate ammonia-lyase [Paenibacillus sp. J31TS4]GIP40033.1 fumarate hydratase class II [Paenibacillus sp. J31TS4]
MNDGPYRTSRDSLGDVHVPEEAYYGPQTQRAVQNFPISGLRLPRRFIKAQGQIKGAAAYAHAKLGVLDERLAQAIGQAAEEVAEGRWDAQFVVDVYQAGAGTSQNMNANEVIANRALELLGEPKDKKDVIHPNDHVNKSQSTNDTIPTAIYLSAYDALEEELLPSLKRLIEALREKAKEFHPIVKSGRTHLQDAVPIRLGQEFSGYVHTLEPIVGQVEQVQDRLLAIGIGGNAVGTGVNLPPGYIPAFLEELRRLTGRGWRQPASRFAFMQNPSGALEASSVLRNLAVHLMKITSDLRLLASGPNTGLAEIVLPAVQPGSSIMPGKVNPVLPEMMYMVGSQVIGNDTAIQTAMLGSQLEINVMMPVIAHNLLQSVTILANAMDAFSSKCVQGIQANEEKCAYWMEQSLSLVTMLNPVIGYDRAAELAKQAVKTGRPLKEIVLEAGVVTPEQWQELIDRSTEEH